MADVPIFKYEELKSAPELGALPMFQLLLSENEAASLRKAESRIHTYQMLEALSHSKARKIFAAVRVAFGELIEMLLRPRLSEVRGLLLSRQTAAVEYGPPEHGRILVTINNSAAGNKKNA